MPYSLNVNIIQAEDKVRKVLLYIESVVYFIYSVAVQIPNRDARTQGRHPYGMLRDTAELLKYEFLC